MQRTFSAELEDKAAAGQASLGRQREAIDAQLRQTLGEVDSKKRQTKRRLREAGPPKALQLLPKMLGADHGMC